MEKSKYSAPFQTPEFYDLFNSNDGLSANVFAIEKDGDYKALAVVTIQKEKGISRNYRM